MTLKYTFKPGDTAYIFNGYHYQKVTIEDMNPIPKEPGFCSILFGNSVQSYVSKDDIITPEERQLFDNSYWHQTLSENNFLAPHVL